jgi:hypothetical protein
MGNPPDTEYLLLSDIRGAAYRFLCFPVGTSKRHRKPLLHVTTLVKNVHKLTQHLIVIR